MSSRKEDPLTGMTRLAGGSRLLVDTLLLVCDHLHGLGGPGSEGLLDGAELGGLTAGVGCGGLLLGALLLDLGGLLGEDQLDVGGAAEVRVDTTVGTESPAALLGGLVDLDVLDVELVDVQLLGLQ